MLVRVTQATQVDWSAAQVSPQDAGVFVISDEYSLASAEGLQSPREHTGFSDATENEYLIKLID